MCRVGKKFMTCSIAELKCKCSDRVVVNINICCSQEQ